MTLITKFEDLECWQLSRQFVKEIYILTKKEKLDNDFGFQNQIRRASLSIMNNIAEGFGRKSRKDFKRYLDIAIGSLQETKSMIYLAYDLNYFSRQQSTEFHDDCELIKSKILKMISYLNTKIKEDSK